MKQFRHGLALVLFIASYFMVNAQGKYSTVKIFYSNLPERNELIGLLGIDHFIPEKNAIISEISERNINQLRLRNAKYQVLVDDVAKNLEKLNRKYYADKAMGLNLSTDRVAIEQPGGLVDAIIPQPAAFQVKSTFGGYYSFAEMEAAMTTLITTYPSIATKTSIGKTAENRDIWLIKISDNAATDEANEPEVIYLGLQHAREAITGASMIFFMQYLCESYSKDTRIKDLVDNREIYVIPCFNPDGWEYNRTTATGTVNKAGGGWRKNRVPLGKYHGADEFGVDLNRNWGVDWGNCSQPILGSSTSCGSNTLSDETYYGPNAFSELETQAVRAFAQAHHIVAGFDQHSYGPYYSLPFGRKSLGHVMSQKGKDFYTAIPALMGTYNGMRAADSYDALGYEVAGGFKDWMLMGDLGIGSKDSVWAMTGEGAAGGGSSYAGTYADFWAPASEIVNLSQAMCYQNLQLAYAAGTYIDIQDANDIAISSSSGNLSFSAKRLGLANDPVQITLVPIENIQTVGPAVTIPGLAYYETNNGSIAYSLKTGIANGERIKYAWKVTMGGYSYSDTIIRFYNPTSLLNDDMEGSFSNNWIASSNTTDNWAYTTLSAYAGTHSMTESPAGDYTTSTTRTVTYKNTLDLSSNTAAFLNFWTKYRAENFRDKLQVQVSTNSTDGVNGTWVAITGTTTIQEPGTLDGSTLNSQPAFTGIRDYWTQETFDVSAYKSSNFRFRFAFTSDGDPSSFKFEKDDGFYIDNLKVVKSTVPFSVLPVHFISFYGNVLPDNSVKLNWEAVTDAQHDYFEIERSNDGNNFIAIGKIIKLPPYQFIDLAAKPGNNLYRIKQVDKDGKINYSKIIKIIVKNNFDITVFPNPVHNKLSIKIANKQEDILTIQISDMQGQVIYNKKEPVGVTSSELMIDTQIWNKQTYFIKIINSKNEVISTKKIIKL